MLTFNIDTAGLEKKLNSLRKKEIPTAARNTLNDLMRDVVNREKKEIIKIFHAPTKIVWKSPIVKEEATKQKLYGEVWLEEGAGKSSTILLNTLTPHIPGYPSVREPKGMESQLIRMGLMKKGQYLMPSRAMKLNKFGNITGSVASKMLHDINAFSGIYKGNLRTKETKVKYIWGTVKKKNGGTVTGIWLQSRFNKQQGNALKMVVVDASPTYGKRFKFHALAKSWAKKRMPYHAELAVQHAIRRRYGK